MMAKPFWTPAMDLALKGMAAAGMSSAAIACELSANYGHSFSRNAVIGRAHRKGIDLTYGREKKEKPPAVAKPKRPVVVNVQKEKYKPVIRKLEKDLTPEERKWGAQHFLNPDAKAKTFFSLKANECKFPVGEIKTSTLRFCGAPTEPGKVYCDYCRKISYYPPKVPVKVASKRNGN